VKPSLVDMLAELEAGRCPTCSGDITGTREIVGGHVLAEPCGHVLRRGPIVRDPRPAAPRPVRSGAAAQDRWERDHDDDPEAA